MTDQPPPLLAVRGLRKAFGAHVVLADLDLDVGDGEIVAVVGTNGVGKSTLLECLTGAVRWDAGTVRIAGETSDPSSAAHWREVFGILDDFAWLPDLTVADHLLLLSPDQDRQAVRQALAALGVAGLADRLPESLSAGQRQRAALATAHVRPWRALLLDEPERHLDASGVARLAAGVNALAAPGRGVLLATHSPDLLDRLDCRTVTLEPGLVE